MTLFDHNQVVQTIAETTPFRLTGRVSSVTGLLVEGTVPGAHLGMMCRLRRPGTKMSEAVPAEIVALRGNMASLMPLSGVQGIHSGTEIFGTPQQPQVTVGDGLLGRVLDGWGHPIDSLGSLSRSGQTYNYALDPPPFNPLERSFVERRLSVGVRAIDTLLTCGEGQRLAILSGAGVGKSTLLGMMARNTEADVTVIGLIGERSREVKRFVERDLGPNGLRHAVVIAATADHAPALRVRAARVATSVAEYFRDQGKRVLLLMDSLSRVAMAQRELGLAVGEPPATKGYPPSAFAIIPRLLERAGPGVGSGSITAFYTVLLEADDLGDPIGDAVRATTDGHIVLSRKLSDRGHFPSIDPLHSVSRVMPEVTTPRHMRAAMKVREIMADYREVEELVTLGAYERGTSPRFDRALNAFPVLQKWLAQETGEVADVNKSMEMLYSLVDRYGANL
jgi:flagellum-specific ATP synthase